MLEESNLTRIPFFLITGFLGSGKTTFLKNILLQYSGKEKLAIIQNEFATANIDGKDLRETNIPFSLLEINNGSVFCVCLLSGFKKSLVSFISQKTPDKIIMEASGLSDPIAVAQIFDAPELRNLVYLAGIYAIIDGSSFLNYSQTFTRLNHQVRVADKVIINKIDLDKTFIPEIKAKLLTLNPFAQVIEATYCQVDFSGLFIFQTQLAAQHYANDTNYTPASGPDGIQSGVLKMTSKITELNLKKFLDYFTPSLIRLKGFVNLKEGKVAVVNYASNNLQIKYVVNYEGSTEMVAMGENFNLSEFSKKFKSLTK